MSMLKSGKPKGYYSKASRAARRTGRKHIYFDDSGNRIKRKYTRSGKYVGQHRKRAFRRGFGHLSAML